MEPLGVLCLGSGNPATHSKTSENSYNKSYLVASLDASDGQPSGYEKGENRSGQTAGSHPEGDCTNVESSKHMTMLAAAVSKSANRPRSINSLTPKPLAIASSRTKRTRREGDQLGYQQISGRAIGNVHSRRRRIVGNTGSGRGKRSGRDHRDRLRLWPGSARRNLGRRPCVRRPLQPGGDAGHASRQARFV